MTPLAEQMALRMTLAAAMAHAILSNAEGLRDPAKVVVLAYAVADELIATQEASMGAGDAQ